PPGDVAVTTAWYREVAGKFRAEAMDPSNKRRKASVVPLVEVWEHLDGSWGELLADFEDNGREFTTELAARCQHVGAAMLACGLHMTPLRLISIRVLHKFDHALNIPCLHTRCRNPNSCPKNHVKYTHNTQLNTNKTTIHLEHWKNEKRQGPLDITVPAGRGVEVLELMERAAAFLGPQARGLMFPQQNLRLFGVDSFEDSHFSQAMGSWLTPPGRPHVSFNQARSMWITLWSDYVDQAQLLPGDVTAQLLKECAAALVGNSSDTWKSSYDARARMRGCDRVHAHYPSFIEFAKQRHSSELATLARNPVTGSLG
ncbi:hypothetical protein N2152v2_010228, partial [Parachlorella kessleri]